ncbi:BON domain-containing protein [Paraburkholderia diazotrophica]|uniref:BON domain-containing protein n=1 Tax=Paraburkholderia diazotrophica TaxID=667676 RepID=A0A1H6XWW6_9BURK|nr:BON domain-containing protein [Paraburkholderia diazotrophica]SEJ33549.1 BON domain-containing protein [Paraburkholderia diazotrophica]
MNTFLKSVTAAVIGAAAMYYFDNHSGKRRRAMLRDKMASTTRRISKRSRAQARRAAGHAYGVLHRAASSAPTSDRQLTDRVRAHLGRIVATPGAIHVRVEQGVAWISGHVLAADRERVIRETAAVPGVERVEEQLCVHEQAGNVPELQGATLRG